VRVETVVVVKPPNGRWLVFAVAALAVVSASLVPTGAAPSAVEEAHATANLVWHAATYFLLTALALHAVDDRERWLVVAAGIIVLGAGVELAQAFVPYRTASLFDVAANAAGVFAALGFAWCARQARTVRKV